MISLQEIISITDDDKTEMMLSESTIFEVIKANPYEEIDKQKKYVQIKVLDVLFNDQVCNLVFIKDITYVYEKQEQQKTYEHIIMANDYTSKQLQEPLQNILTLTKQLVDD